jgi:hypothetical protein
MPTVMSTGHVTVDFESFAESVKEALDAMGAHRRLSEEAAILVKPNLVMDSPHPVTTSAECCEAVIEYVRLHSRGKIVIAEGCGDAKRETGEIFESLGFAAMAERQDVELMDLNYGPVRKLSNPRCTVFHFRSRPQGAFPGRSDGNLEEHDGFRPARVLFGTPRYLEEGGVPRKNAGIPGGPEFLPGA